ncbi:MAG: hypothetical protein R3F59_21200 [Myxococcota bacterium]
MDPHDTFTVSGRLLHAGAPAPAWLEVHDDDGVLHDYLAAGRCRPDGTFDLRFSRHAFNQQAWEREDAPDLVLFAWHPVAPDARPDVDDPPTHCARFPPTAFRDRAAALGDIPLDGPARSPRGWWLRQANTSYRPGTHWTLEQVTARSDQVRGWVLDTVRTRHPPRVTLRLGPLQSDDAVGAYLPETREIVLDPVFLTQLDQDAVLRLLAHEWAHATAHDAMGTLDGAVNIDGSAELAAWAVALADHTPLSAEDLGAALLVQAATANHEGYAHYVEQRVVRRHLPLSAYPAEGRWAQARTEVLDRQLQPAAFRLWLAQHDALALRHLGLAWYRHRYGEGHRRVRFHRAAGSELLRACMDRFERLVRGEGRAQRAPRLTP